MKYIDRYRLKLSLTNECNYNCKYCFLHYPDTIKPRLERFKQYVEQIEEILIRDNFNKVRVCISGGEPTLVPFFNEFMGFLFEYFKNYDVMFRVTTNGAQINKILNIMENFKKINNQNHELNITLSYHHIDSKLLFGEFYNNIARPIEEKKKQDNRVNEVTTMFMLENSESCFNEYNKIINQKIYKITNITFAEIVGVDNYYNKYNKYNRHQVLEKNNEIGLAKAVIKNNKNKACNALVNSSYIKPNGDYFPCANCDTLTCKVGNLNSLQTINKIKRYKEFGAYICDYNKCFNYFKGFEQENIVDFIKSRKNND